MDVPAVVPAWLRERARTHADRLFVACAHEHRSFSSMFERAERVAAGLADLGVTNGDRVATILPNSMDHVDLIFACARLGAIHVPFNVFLKGDFLRYQLEDCGASVVIGDDDGVRALEAIGGAGLEHVLTTLPTGDRAPDVDLEARDTLAIIYTSGTTGMPKGCMLPHGYHVRSPTSGNDLLEYRDGDVLYTALPLFHGWARGMLFAALMFGLTLHLDAEFSATVAMQRIRETKATVFSAVGAMGMALLAQPPTGRDRDNDLRLAFMIPFPPEQQRAFTDRFGPQVQAQMYGQTESGAITYSPLNEPGPPASVGKASPNYDVRVADDGEVLIKAHDADWFYTGYWNKPDETREAMRDGWHHTGDLGRFDDDGYLYFVDRKKDALRRRGENISSVQLEAAIIAHPKINECAIVAVPSDLTEDDIKACIVVAEAPEPEELYAFFTANLPYFAVPRYVEIVDALPKTATMRVQKHILRNAGVTQKTWDFEKLGLQTARDRRRS